MNNQRSKQLASLKANVGLGAFNRKLLKEKVEGKRGEKRNHLILRYNVFDNLVLSRTNSIFLFLLQVRKLNDGLTRKYPVIIFIFF